MLSYVPNMVLDKRATAEDGTGALLAGDHDPHRLRPGRDPLFRVPVRARGLERFRLRREQRIQALLHEYGVPIVGGDQPAIAGQR
jgi:hypothetical protein